MTIANLSKLGYAGQFSKLYLTFDAPPTVYTGLVHEPPDSMEKVVEIGYDNGAGVLASVLPGMTMLVHSSAGVYKGAVRIRNEYSTATRFYIGQTDDIQWAEDDILTVINDFDLWPRRPLALGTSFYQDWGIAYDNQNSVFHPWPCMGPPAVLWLTGATVDYTPDASGSWALDDTIASYVWTAPGASATADLTTATPTITYNAAGRYLVSCTVTTTTGAKSSIGWRKVYVHDANNMPEVNFALEAAPKGEYDEGGWMFEVTMFDGADLTSVADKAMVVLHAIDYYNGEKLSIGPLVGYENIIAWGWIDENEIDWSPEQGVCRFKVYGPAYWLDRLAGMPFSLTDKNTTPAKWEQSDDLTVDKALFFILYWRTTAATILDAFLTGDVRRASILSSVSVSTLEQLRDVSDKIHAMPVCNRYGQLYVEIDTQLLQLADRAGIEIIRSIDQDDWHENIEIECQPVAPVSILEASGSSFSGTTEAAYYSRAHGLDPNRYGGDEDIDGLIVNSQDDLNEQTGMAMAKLINPYPWVGIEFAENDRTFDIAPRKYLTLSIADASTPRGITWTAQKLIPRVVEYNHDPETGTLLTSAEFEPETYGPAGVTYVPPPIIDEPPEPPDGGGGGGGGIPGGGGGGTGDDCWDDLSAPVNGPFRIGGAAEIASNGTASVDMAKSCWVRDKDSDHDTRVVINGSFEQLNPSTGLWEACLVTDHITVTAHRYGALVATAVFNPTSYGAILGDRQAYFSSEPVDGANANVFRITIGERDWLEAGALLEWIEDDPDVVMDAESIYEFEHPDNSAWGWIVYKLTASYTSINKDRLYVKATLLECTEGFAALKLMKTHEAVGGTDYNTITGTYYTPRLTDNTSGHTFATGETYPIVGTLLTVGTDFSIGGYFLLMYGFNAPGTWRIDEIGVYNDTSGVYTPFTFHMDARIRINHVDLYNICDWT